MTDTTDTFTTAWEAPMSTRGVLAVSHSSTKFLGLQHGTLTMLSSVNVPGLGQVATLHEEGSSYWAARGERRYSGAILHTILLDPSTADRLTGRYVLLSSANLSGNAADRAARNLANFNRINSEG